MGHADGLTWKADRNADLGRVGGEGVELAEFVVGEHELTELLANDRQSSVEVHCRREFDRETPTATVSRPG